MKLLSHLRSNAIAYLALFAALGGSAYAVGKVGSKQIKTNAIKAKHIKNDQVTGADVNEATLELPKTGAGAAGPAGPAGAQGEPGIAGPEGPEGPQGPEGPEGHEGPEGPQGIQGIQGQQGTPGTARAYARVHSNGVTFDLPRTQGFTAVRRPSAGTYCLTAANGINPGNRPYTVSVDWQTTSNPSSAASALYNITTSPCNADEFMVLTQRTTISNGSLSTSYANDVGFTMIVP